MDKRHLLEAASLVSESASEDGTWKVRVISEGKGSSGIYTAELLEKHHGAFDNVLSFKNHPTGWDGPQERDFTMIAGMIVGETWIEKDERGLTAVFANYLPDPEYKDKLERYKDKLGLSIYIEGSGHEDENGEYIVDWLNPEDPYGSLDVVIAPGARGKFMENMRKTYESAVKAGSTKHPGARQVENKENKLDKEALEAALKPISDAIATLLTKDEAAKAAAEQATADADAVKSAVEAYAQAEKAIAEADLLDVQVESIRAAAMEGRDVSALIESAKAVKEAAVKAVKESESQDDAPVGRILGEANLKSAADLGKVFG